MFRTLLLFCALALCVLCHVSLGHVITFRSPKARVWSYHNLRQWADLNPAFSTCKTGKQQSPIDINKQQDKHLLTTQTMNFTFADIEQKTLQSLNRTLSLPLSTPAFHSDNTLQIDYETETHLILPFNSTRKFTLVQSHYHAPGEHSFDGSLTAAELHLVHQSSDGRLAVVGVLMNGTRDGFVVGEDESIHDLIIQHTYNTTQPHSYYVYNGSLTTPPCSETVTWLVNTAVLNVNEEWLNNFTTSLDAKERTKTHRPVQSRNGRTVSIINSLNFDVTTHHHHLDPLILVDFVSTDNSSTVNNSSISAFLTRLRLRFRHVSMDLRLNENIVVILILAFAAALIVVLRKTLFSVKEKRSKVE